MIEIGSIGFRVYGLLIGIGILVGFWVAEKVRLRFLESESQYKDFSVWDLLWWVVIPAIVLGRIYHVMGLWSYYRENILLIPQVWTGGMGIFGGILGGAGGLFVFSKIVQRKGVNFWSLLDLAAFGLPIGQAIGRWGNFFNQELYGRPTDLPWGIRISLEHRAKSVEQYTHFHPLFFYESLWSLLTFGVLMYLLRKKGADLRVGNYFSIYLVLYGLGRFWLEFLRIDPWKVWGVNVAQVVGILFILIGLSRIWKFRLKL